MVIGAADPGFTALKSLGLGLAVYAQTGGSIFATGGGGGSKISVPKLPKPDCDFSMAIVKTDNTPIRGDFCTGEVLNLQAALLEEGKGPGTYTYKWEVVNSSNIVIEGPDDGPWV